MYYYYFYFFSGVRRDTRCKMCTSWHVRARRDCCINGVFREIGKNWREREHTLTQEGEQHTCVVADLSVTAIDRRHICAISSHAPNERCYAPWTASRRHLKKDCDGTEKKTVVVCVCRFFSNISIQIAAQFFFLLSLLVCVVNLAITYMDLIYHQIKGTKCDHFDCELNESESKTMNGCPIVAIFVWLTTSCAFNKCCCFYFFCAAKFLICECKQ